MKIILESLEERRNIYIHHLFQIWLAKVTSDLEMATVRLGAALLKRLETTEQHSLQMKSSKLDDDAALLLLLDNLKTAASDWFEDGGRATVKKTDDNRVFLTERKRERGQRKYSWISQLLESTRDAINCNI